MGSVPRSRLSSYTFEFVHCIGYPGITQSIFILYGDCLGNIIHSYGMNPFNGLEFSPEVLDIIAVLQVIYMKLGYVQKNHHPYLLFKSYLVCFIKSILYVDWIFL
jgi:hypothetical protein